jgi:hypothetical protein
MRRVASVLNLIEICPKCHTSFMPSIGEVCQCEEVKDKQEVQDDKIELA